MSALTTGLTVGAGAAMTLGTIAAWKATHDQPTSPGRIAGAEIATLAAIPLTVTTGIGLLVSWPAGILPGNGHFVGGAALAVMGLGAVEGAQAIARSMREH